MDLLKEDDNKILTQRRSPEERQKNYLIATNKKIQQYMKDGSKGDLNLNGTPITSLPNDLKKVGGSLYLRGNPITSLPVGLIVRGYLNLWGTAITSLPTGLKVGEDLNLNNTKITSLPDDLLVGGSLYLWNTSLSKKYTEKQIRQMAPGIKGNIYL